MPSPQDTPLGKDMRKLDTLFGAAEDAMLATFGDGYRVTIDREGEIEIVEYQHD